jgi:hypothetical protein
MDNIQKHNILRRIEFQFAERNKLKHNLSEEGCASGKDLLVSLVKRNPSVIIRKPEATSVSDLLKQK